MCEAHTRLQICPIPHMLLNMRNYVGGQQMNLSWWDAAPNIINEVTYWATSQKQSDSNWETSVFVYKDTADCEDCKSDVVTLNFRFEVSKSYLICHLNI